MAANECSSAGFYDKMRRIGVLSLVSNQTVMGAGKVVMEFASQAAQYGVDYLPVCLVRGKNKSNYYVRALQEVGIAYECIYERHRLDFGGMTGLIRLIKHYRPDVIEAHGHRETIYLLFLQPFVRSRIVIFFHGWTETNYLTREGSFINTWIWKHSPLIITVCEDFKKRLCALGVPPSKIHVVYNGISPHLCYARPSSGDVRREWNLPDNSRLLLVMGRLSGEKGQANFLRAFALVANEQPDVRAFIVGDGPDRNYLQSLANDLRLASRVVFTGYQHDVRKYYEAADVLVVPSKSEGIPNVVLEAMVFGVPIISTRVGGIPEVIQDGLSGLLVPSENPKALAEGILRLLSDRKLAQRLVQGARQECLPRFTTARRCAKLADLYQRLLE